MSAPVAEQEQSKNTADAVTEPTEKIVGIRDNPRTKILKYIFGDATGEVTVFDADGGEDDLGEVVDLGEMKGLPPAKDISMAMQIGDLVYGVIVDDPAHATFTLSKGNEEYGVCLFKAPVSLDDVPERFEFEVDLDWDFKEVTGQRFDAAEVLASLDADAPASAGVEDQPKGKLNDAVLLGHDSEQWRALLEREMTFMEARDKKAMKLHRHTRKLRDWLSRKDDKDPRPKGLTHHVPSPEKNGKCVVLGEGVDGRRTAKAMTKIDAIGQDLDNGTLLAPVLERLTELGLGALVYTTHSHLHDEIEVLRSDVVKKTGVDKPRLEDVQRFLREYDLHGYVDEVIDNATVVDFDRATPNGGKIILKTIPIPKFRVVCFFEETVTRELRGSSDKQRAANWEHAVKSLASKLGVHIDPSTIDQSRLFYTPRHHPERDFEMYVVQGRGVTWDELQDHSNPFKDAGRGTEKAYKSYSMPSGASLKQWAAAHGKGFQPKELLAGSEYEAGDGSGDFLGIVCPFGDEHGNGETGGGYVKDADDGAWLWKCQHATCNGRDRLEFVEKALADGWC